MSQPKLKTVLKNFVTSAAGAGKELRKLRLETARQQKRLEEQHIKILSARSTIKAITGLRNKLSGRAMDWHIGSTAIGLAEDGLKELETLDDPRRDTDGVEAGVPEAASVDSLEAVLDEAGDGSGWDQNQCFLDAARAG